MPTDTLRKREQIALGNRIVRIGIEMMPCSFCERNNKKCFVAPSESKRCSECARQGKKCDVVGPSVGDWRSLEEAEDQLDVEERFTRETAATAMAKLERLAKQRRFLKRRGSEMLHQGLKIMDELDEAEETERVEQDAQEAELEAARRRELCSVDISGPSAFFDWASAGFDQQEFDSILAAMSYEEWQVIQGSPGGTPQASGGAVGS